jgi:hypothetical protein
MKFLISIVNNIFKPLRDKLLLIDGDSTTPADLLKYIDPSEFSRIEVFCDTNNYSRWVNSHEFYDIYFSLNNPEKDAADKNLITTLLDLTVNSNSSLKKYPGGIYIAANDKRYIRSISIFSKMFPTTIISRFTILTSIPSLKSSITIAQPRIITTPARKAKSNDLYKIIKSGHSLVRVGQLLHRNDISYSKLSDFLTKNGYAIDQEKKRVISVPMVN